MFRSRSAASAIFVCSLTFRYFAQVNNFLNLDGCLLLLIIGCLLFICLIFSSSIRIQQFCCIALKSSGPSCSKRRYLNELVSGQNINSSSKYNIKFTRIFAEKKMWVAFTKATHIFSAKNISIYAIFNGQSFNDTLNNDVVSFEQLGPDFFGLKFWAAPRENASSCHMGTVKAQIMCSLIRILTVH